MKNGFRSVTRTLQMSTILLTLFLCFRISQAQTPIPSPSPAPTPITKTGNILVSNPSTVGRISKWVTSSNNGTGTIGDSVIIESTIGTIGIGTNPFSDFKLGVDGGSTRGGVFGSSISNIAVFGNSFNGWGVVGTSTQGYGVFGTSDVKYGVRGQSYSGDGVSGASAIGNGIFGISQSGYAGYFQGNVNITNNLSTGHLFLNSAGTLNFGDGTVQTTAAKLTGVTAGTGLSGGGNVGNVTVGIAAGGVNTSQLADGAVTSAKIGAGAVGGTQLMNSSVTTPHLSDDAVTGPKIAAGQVVRSINGLADHVTLVAGDNVTITASGNMLTISGSTTNASSRFNPQQIAMLRWYEINRTAEFSGFAGPFGMAFDGINVWVTNQGAGNTQSGTTINRIRQSDGKILETYSVGTGPSGIAYDGAFIWVANYRSDTVTKLNPLDGSIVATYQVGDQPLQLCFDGTFLWVGHVGIQSGVTRIDARTGTVFGPIFMNPPNKIAFDGTNVWIANGGNNTVTVLNASSGTVAATHNVGNAPYAVTFDGTHMWVSNVVSNNVMKLDKNTGAVVATFSLAAHPRAIVFDGVHIWVSHESQGLYKLRASDGQVLGVYPTGDGAFEAVFDGANLLVANTYANTISKR